ncbi:MAG: sodium/proton-translocating pyrophosphatase, partial [Acidimicrobiia bacterium]|nr:sodium/proton-translocating pyrophosphatase [Acidimicrobiia bacterium]
MSAIPYLALVSAVAALLLAGFFYTNVKAASPGNDRMQFLMREIQTGAKAFLRQEYTWVAGFVVVMAILIGIAIEPRGLAALTYVFGAVLSGTAGYIGMTVATMANARTTEAAKDGPARALPLAFRGGAVMGFTVAGLALAGIAIVYIVFIEIGGVDDGFNLLTSFGLGASSIALFSRVGGGIYTKAADVGADLVGKVEAGIPEDDPRNPATIADNVGDNVGDVAGMGADLFESYGGSIIAPIALTAFTILAADNTQSTDFISENATELLLFPLAIAAVGMLGSIMGSFTVKGGASTDAKALSRQLHMGTNVAMGITLLGTVLVGFLMFDGAALGGEEVDNWWGLALSVIGGLAVGWAIGKVAEIWTSDHYGPVKKIARQSETGPATTVLAGISGGMLSVGASVLLIVSAV